MINKKLYFTLLSGMLFFYSGDAVGSTPQRDDLRIIKVTQKNGDELLSKASALYSKGQYGAALMELDRAAISPILTREKKSTIDFMATICKAKLMKESTVGVLENYIASSDNRSLASLAMLELAQEFIMLDDIQSAGEIFSGIDEKYLDKSSRQSYRFSKAYLDLYAGRNDEAYKGFESCIGMTGDKGTQAKYLLGYLDYTKGNLDNAYSRFTEVASLKGYENVNLYLLQIKFLKADFNYVATQGSEILKMSLSDDAALEVKRLMGESNFNLAKYSVAINWLEQYQKEGGDMNRELHYQMGYSYYMQNIYIKSTEHFAKIIIGSDALAQNAYYHLADAYLKTGDKKGAMRAFSMAASFDFEKKITEDALFNYARMTYESTESGLYAQKIEVLKRYVNEFSNSERTNEIRSYLLTLYLNSSNYDAAMLELSLLKNPSDDIKQAVQRLCYNKGTELFAARNYTGAIEQFNKSLGYALSPKLTALARFWKAESLFKTGNYGDEVIKLYEAYMIAAQSSLKEYKMAQYNMGYIYFNREDWGKAVDALRKFIQNYKTTDKFMSDAHIRLADAYFAQRQYSSAKDNYAKAMQMGDAAYDYAQLQIAVSEGLMGHNDQKINTLQSIIKRGKSVYHDQVMIELASTYNKMGQFNNGVEVLEGMIASRNKSPYMPSALLELGVGYVNSGKEDDAITTYKKLIADYSSSSEAQDALVAVKSIYVSKGDVEPYFAYVKSIGKEGGIDNSERERLRYDALQRQFIAGNYEKVIESADNYRSEFANGVHAVDVSYYLSEALATKNHDRADEELKNMMAMELNQYTIASLHTASKYYIRRNRAADVLKCYNDIYTLSDNASERRDMLDLVMEQSIKLDDAAQIKEAAELVMSDKSATPKAIELAQFAQGREKYNRGDWSGAITQLSKVNIPHSKAEGIQCLFLIADAKFKNGDIKGSEKVIAELSNSDTPHQYWVARSFILYGDIYAKKGDLFQAKATYQSIVEGYGKLNDGIITMAEKRIEELASGDKNKATPDTTATQK